MATNESPINGRLQRPRRLRAAIGDAVLAVEDRAIWPLADGTRNLFDAVRWAFERTLLWPLADRFAVLDTPARIAASAGAAIAAVALVVAVVVLAGSSGSAGSPAASTVALAPARPNGQLEVDPAPKPKPTLHGAAPVFKAPAKSEGSDEVDPARAVAATPSPEATSAGAASAAGARISSRPTGSTATAGATTSAAGADSIPGRPAGAEALAVARDFSNAFVVYETGGEEAKVRTVFARTATPKLAKALLKRPPRLPADVEVPRAKVVNVVPGPSREGIYTVSVSLLRVGVTSELRLEMEMQKNEGWRVVNALG
jgi:hypothetical protein